MTDKTARIRLLNDVLRTKGIGGRLIITSGVAALPSAALNEILLAVQGFDAFTPDNDPWGEHDCAVLTAAGQRIMFKIDYYDRTMSRGSSDASDIRLTRRVLTIMLASEY